MDISNNEMESLIERDLKIKVDFSKLSNEEALLEYRKLIFPHRFQKKIAGIKQCEECKYREIIFGNPICLLSRSTECINNNFKLKETIKND
jgi:hypothetical protein